MRRPPRSTAAPRRGATCLLLGAALTPLLVLTPPVAEARVSPGGAVTGAASDGRGATGAVDGDTRETDATRRDATGAGPADTTRTATAAPAPAGAWTSPVGPGLDVHRDFAPPASAWGPGHRGVDLRARAGTVVRAAGAGTVAHAGPVAGRGVVSLAHGALRTTYEPVRPLVSAGETVVAGQPVGVLGRSASHCAPSACLHWGLRRGGTYLDPLVLLGQGPVRLLPVWDVAVAPR